MTISPPERSIALIGPPGAGKSTVGRLLAERLSRTFIDTDRLITATHGPIPKIFREEGEDEFRRLERLALNAALDNPNSVVSTGGGVVVNPINRVLLKASAYVIFVDVTAKAVESRVNGQERPLLSRGLQSWIELYSERVSWYRDLADLTIDTSETSPTNCVKSILNDWEVSNLV